MTEHTKLPWHHSRKSVYVSDINHTCIAQMIRGQTENEANAAFIVKSVNNHDALVEALTVAAERLEARGHNFGAREARKAFDAFLPTAEDVRGILGPVSTQTERGNG